MLCVALLESDGSRLLYILDAHLLLGPQIVPHTEDSLNLSNSQQL